MAIITCRECGTEFSDRAKTCPLCACPVEFSMKETKAPVVEETFVEEPVTEMPVEESVIEVPVEESVMEPPVAEVQRSTLDPENVALLNTLASKLKISAILWIIFSIPQCYPCIFFIPIAVLNFRTASFRSKTAKRLKNLDANVETVYKKFSTFRFVFSCISVFSLPALLYDKLAIEPFLEQNKEALEKIGL